VGDAGLESNSWGFVFRGQRILEAIFAELRAGVAVTTSSLLHFANHTHTTVTSTQTYALTAASRVLFGGCSAGARGAMFNLDYVQQMMPDGAPPVVGFLDSPLWVDVQPAEASIMPLENETQAVFALVNATARLSDACAAAYPGAEGWKCLYGQVRPRKALHGQSVAGQQTLALLPQRTLCPAADTACSGPPQYRIPFVTTPYLLSASQFDR
jgi:hypothetical protein